MIQVARYVIDPVSCTLSSGNLTAAATDERAKVKIFQQRSSSTASVLPTCLCPTVAQLEQHRNHWRNGTACCPTSPAYCSMRCIDPALSQLAPFSSVFVSLRLKFSPTQDSLSSSLSRRIQSSPVRPDPPFVCAGSRLQQWKSSSSLQFHERRYRYRYRSRKPRKPFHIQQVPSHSLLLSS